MARVLAELYTSSEWGRVFTKYSSIVVTDDGLIHDGDDYRKWNYSGQYGIGKIDFDRKEIYGDDYYGFSARPIAYLKEENHVTAVYEYGARDPFLIIDDNGDIYSYSDWDYNQRHGFTREQPKYHISR